MAQESAATVHIVDDEADVRATIAAMLGPTGFAIRQYSTADDLLGRASALEPGCIITDVNMPGLSGLELIGRLREAGANLGVIVISGQADVPMAVDAMKAGAIEFLVKPLHIEPLREAVAAAVQHDPAPQSSEADNFAMVIGSLTPRQREVFAGIVEGLSSKMIARRLDLSPRTVEAYRAAIMNRTRAKSLSDLVRLGIQAGL